MGHTVFLSHSGEDKDFVRILAEELRKRTYIPFFDEESLRIGNRVTMDDILELAKAYKLGIIVLSDDFFSKTWNPMLELVTFVQHGIPFLPLFYKLTVRDVQDPSKKQSWMHIWSQWSTTDTRINVSDWEMALNALTGITGLEYHRIATNYVQYARLVAEEVCCILSPDLCPSDEHVQGRERLYQEVKKMFANAPEVRAAKVLALCGMEGVGKSALCTTLRKSYRADFAGRVCYVEFTRQQNNQRSQNSLQLKDIHTVCLELTNTNSKFVKDHITDVDKGIAYLDNYLPSSKKFLLILDNVHEYSVDEARKLVLDRKSFPYGSHLLFLGRSHNSLARLLRTIDNGHMIRRFPDLHFEEAERIFLNETLFLSQDEWVIQQHKRDYAAQPNMQAIVKQCINLCTVSRGCGSYNPQMLKSLALFLPGCKKPQDLSKWKAYLSKLEKDRSEAMGNMFELLQQSYDALQQHEKDLFLDLALYTLAGKDVKKLHFEQEEPGIDDCLLNLTGISFLSKDNGVLDLHRDFARKLVRRSGELFYVQGEKFKNIGSLYSRLLQKELHQKKGCLKRLAFVKCTFSLRGDCLDLSDEQGIGVLLLDSVEGLASLNLGLNRLCRMEVKSTRALQVKVNRTISLTVCTQFDPVLQYDRLFLLDPRYLVILELGRIDSTPWKVDATLLGEFESLKYVQLENIELTNSNVLELSCWPCLEELKLSNLTQATMLSGLQNLTALRKFALAACNQLSELHLPCSLRHCSIEKCEGLIKIEVVAVPSSIDEEEMSGGLKEDCTAENKFDVSDCEKLEEINGLCELRDIYAFHYRAVGCLSSSHKVLIKSMKTGLGSVGSFCDLTMEQVRKRGLVQEVLKDARGLKMLKVECSKCGLCVALPPNFGPLPSHENSCHCVENRACLDSCSTSVSFSEDQLWVSFSKPDVTDSYVATCKSLGPGE